MGANQSNYAESESHSGARNRRHKASVKGPSPSRTSSARSEGVAAAPHRKSFVTDKELVASREHVDSVFKASIPVLQTDSSLQGKAFPDLKAGSPQGSSSNLEVQRNKQPVSPGGGNIARASTSPTVSLASRTVAPDGLSLDVLPSPRTASLQSSKRRDFALASLREDADMAADLEDIVNSASSLQDCADSWSVTDWATLCQWVDSGFRCNSCGSNSANSSDPQAKSTVHPRVAEMLQQVCAAYKLSSTETSEAGSEEEGDYGGYGRGGMLRDPSGMSEASCSISSTGTAGYCSSRSRSINGYAFETPNAQLQQQSGAAGIHSFVGRGTPAGGREGGLLKTSSNEAGQQEDVAGWMEEVQRMKEEETAVRVAMSRQSLALQNQILQNPISYQQQQQGLQLQGMLQQQQQQQQRMGMQLQQQQQQFQGTMPYRGQGGKSASGTFDFQGMAGTDMSDSPHFEHVTGEYDLNIGPERAALMRGGARRRSGVGMHRLRRTSSDNMIFLQEADTAGEGAGGYSVETTPMNHQFGQPPMPFAQSVNSTPVHNGFAGGGMVSPFLNMPPAMNGGATMAGAAHVQDDWARRRVMQHQNLQFSVNAAQGNRGGGNEGLGPEACPYMGGGAMGGRPAGYGQPTLTTSGRHSIAHSNLTSCAENATATQPSRGAVFETFSEFNGGKRQTLTASLALHKKLLKTVTKAHDIYCQDDTPNGSRVGDFLLSSLLELTHSKFGLVASVFYKDDGSPYMKTHAITNFAWTRELREWYHENAHKGLVFTNTENLFGEVMVTGETVISNDPKNDPRSSGLPPGHPELHSFLGVPAYMGTDLVGMFCVANRPGGYDAALLRDFEAMTKTVAQVINGINKRKRRKEAENRLFSMLKVAREGLLSVGHTGFITSLNPAARAMFGVSSASTPSSGNNSQELKDSGEESKRGSDGMAETELAPESLHFGDMFYSINSREDFMKLGLDNHLGQVYPALGRKLDGSTVLLEVSLSKGDSADVEFVATIRQLEATL